jgi:hypothetical protein
MKAFSSNHYILVVKYEFFGKSKKEKNLFRVSVILEEVEFALFLLTIVVKLCVIVKRLWPY